MLPHSSSQAHVPAEGAASTSPQGWRRLQITEPPERPPSREPRSQELGGTSACAGAGSSQIPAPGTHPCTPSPATCILTADHGCSISRRGGERTKCSALNSLQENQSLLSGHVLHATSRNGAKSLSLAAREPWKSNLFNFIFFTLGTRMDLRERRLIGQEKERRLCAARLPGRGNRPPLGPRPMQAPPSRPGTPTRAPVCQLCNAVVTAAPKSGLFLRLP